MYNFDEDSDQSGHCSNSSRAGAVRKDHYFKNLDRIDPLKFLEFSINRSSDKILLFTKDRQIHYANDAVARLLGYLHEELSTLAMDAIDPDITPVKWEELWDITKKEGSTSLVSSLKTKDGRLVPVEISFHLFVYNDNEYLCCFIKEIERLKDLENILGNSREVYQLIAETAEDFIYVIDRELIVRYVNRWGARYLGKTPDEVIGKPIERFFPPDVSPNIRDHLINTFDSAKSASYNLNVQIDHNEHTMNTRLFPILDNGHVSYTIGITRDVTDLKKALEALRKSEKDMIKTQSIAHIGNWEWDLLKNDIRCSDEIYRIFGYNPQEFKVTFQHVLSRIHPDDKNLLLKTIARSIKQQKTYQIIFRVVWPDGTVRHIQNEAEIITDIKGLVIMIFGVCQDITELKQANEHRSFLAAIVESSNDAIIGKTLDGKITSWNKGAERIYGYSADEVLGSSISILVPEDKPDEIPGILERIRNGELVDNFETIRLCKDGKKIDISLTVSPIKNSSGDIVGASTIARDITRHKDVEAALKKSERDYRELVDLAQEGIWAIDDRANTIFVNPRMAEMLGYTVDKMLHRTMFSFMDEQGLEIAGKHLEKRKLGVKEVYDSEFIKKDGSRIYTIMNAAPIINEYGGYGGSVAFVTDITYRKMTEKALEDAKMQSDLYLDLMARDINNMNRTGKEYLESVLSEKNLDENTRSMIRKSLAVFEDSSILIEHVRKLQKVKSSNLLLRKMDLGQVLADVQNHYSNIPDRKINIVYKPIKNFTVMANEMLYDAFTSLVDDMVKRSKITPIVNMSIKKMSEGGRLYYAVAIVDRTHGMPGDIRGRISGEHLQSVSNSKSVGIEVYLAKTLIEDFNGKIWVEDLVHGNPEKGRRFIVVLPVADK